ncbi:14926_t:CDS:1 [Gigaspora margarita]|uniref:14926_t:CDS:1 n=1 Tax=Gigaspora margarita TaxID=4874 RepID=A0ABM8VX99_GIGMA|nr:14926_t:CDS:1 [Gigaspora margarita]
MVFFSIKPWFSKEDTVQLNETNEIGIIVVIDNNKASVKLNSKDRLNEVRRVLESNNIIKMTTDINFTNGEAVIDIDDEGEFELEEILVDTNKIHLKRRPNWRELEKRFKLGYGRNYEENKDKVANKKAFIIKDCEFDVFLSDDYYYDTVTISSEDELIRNKSLFLKALAEIQSVKLGVSAKFEKISQSNSKTFSTVQFKNVGKAELSIQEQTIEPTAEFLNEVQKAINLKDPTIVNKIIKEFGQFIPTIIRFGGRLHYVNTTCTVKNSVNNNKEYSANFTVNGQGLESQYNSNTTSGNESTKQSQYSHIFGGDKIKISEGKEDEWISSLQDFRYWVPIEFRKPVSIFEILNEDLKKKLKEIIGKRIIYSNIQDHPFEINNSRNHIVDLEIPSDIENIENIFTDPNIDSQVFVTILNMNENDDVFTYTLYTPKRGYVPKIIIDCIRPNSEWQKECHIKIGWIVVGYDLDFISALSSCDIRFQSTRKEVSAPSNAFRISEDNLLVAYGTPVVFDLNSGFDHLIIGYHFSQATKKTFTCLYGYDLIKQEYTTVPNFGFNILSFIEYPSSEIFDKFKIERKPEKKIFPFSLRKNKNKMQETFDNELPEFVSLCADDKKECQQCYPEFVAKKFERFILEQLKCKNMINQRPHGHCFVSVFNPEAVRKQKTSRYLH